MSPSSLPHLSFVTGVRALGLAFACVIGACGGQAAAPPRPRLSELPARPSLAFISVASDDTFEHLSVGSLDALDRGAYVTDLTCKRVYAAGNRGVCLVTIDAPPESTGSATQWAADIFDERFARLHRIPLSGLPTRVRLSSDGRLAAATVFESGHSYALHGFSTRTILIATGAGSVIGELEQFEVWRDGKHFWSEDFNFWGVTFANDNDTFYATLDTGGTSYLVKGSVNARTAHIVHSRVECPSLSPDGTRVAFKRRIGSRERGWWQLAVLDLASMRETLVSSETRDIDDQVEWIDNERIAYHVTGGGSAADIFAARVDNASPPAVLLRDGYSPAVLRR